MEMDVQDRGERNSHMTLQALVYIRHLMSAER